MKDTLINGKWKIALPDHRAARPEWPHWEEKRLAHMNKTINSGDIIYYVGAEEGDMCGLLAMWGAKLLMFEPNDKVMPNIKAIWEANELDMADRVYPGFASDKTTSTNLIRIQDIEGEVISDHGFRELKDPGDLPQVMIDDLPPPQIISIDVEGSEGKVLRGAEQTLIKHHPKIYLSLHPEFLRDYGEWGAELRRWVIDLGYKETLLDYPLHEVHLYYSEDSSCQK